MEKGTSRWEQVGEFVWGGEGAAGRPPFSSTVCRHPSCAVTDPPVEEAGEKRVAAWGFANEYGGQEEVRLAVGK